MIRQVSKVVPGAYGEMCGGYCKQSWCCSAPWCCSAVSSMGHGAGVSTGWRRWSSKALGVCCIWCYKQCMRQPSAGSGKGSTEAQVTCCPCTAKQGLSTLVFIMRQRFCRGPPLCHVRLVCLPVCGLHCLDCVAVLPCACTGMQCKLIRTWCWRLVRGG